MAWSYVALPAAACSEIVVRLLLRGGTSTDPWHVIGGGIAIAALFVVLGIVVLRRLQRTVKAYTGQQSPV
jgi:hypothetical protein